MIYDKEQYEKIRQMVEKGAQSQKRYNKFIKTIDMLCFLSVPLIIVIVIILHFGMDDLNDIVRLALMGLAVNLIFIPNIIKENAKYFYTKKRGIKTNAMVTKTRKQLRVFMYDATITLSDARSVTVTHREYNPWMKPKNGDIIEIIYSVDNPNGFIWLKDFKVKRRCNIAICITLNLFFFLIWLAIR